MGTRMAWINADKTDHTNTIGFGRFAFKSAFIRVIRAIRVPILLLRVCCGYSLR